LKPWKKPAANRCDSCGETFGFNFACKCGNHL
jgi:ribosomal protein L32